MLFDGGGMTHEFRDIIRQAIQNRKRGLKNVLASVVALDGSSYRKPGVRMLIAEDGSMTGAVSGGCVEKEVLLQARHVFQYHKPVMMTYDGRYRLGCEGILYILIEPFHISEDIGDHLEDAFSKRKKISIQSFFRKEEGPFTGMGSFVVLNEDAAMGFLENSNLKEQKDLLVFTQEMKPLFKILIIGSEHDAVQMCRAASFMGWEVNVIASPKDPRTKANFPGAEELLHITPEEAENLMIDEETAVILMNHNYATDLKFLLAIKEKDPVYIGLLGSTKRREKLFHELIENHPEIRDEFLDKIFGPAGLNIGAITPQEIALSILSEILTVTRKKESYSLRQKQGKIHN